MPSLSIHGYKIKSSVSQDIQNLEDQFKILKANLDAGNAAAHNKVGQFADLTAEWNSKHHANVKNGTYEGMYLGDKIKKTNYEYLIAGFGCYLLSGSDTIVNEPHLVLITDSSCGNMKMNDTNIVTGAYVSSKAYTTYLAEFINKVVADWGSDLIEHDALFSTAVDANGKASSWAWQQVTQGKGRKADIMSQTMVFGDSPGYTIFDNGLDCFQLPLFAQAPHLRNTDSKGTRYIYWLRNPFSSTSFAYAGYTGFATYGTASGSLGVRLYLLIK